MDHNPFGLWIKWWLILLVRQHSDNFKSHLSFQLCSTLLGKFESMQITALSSETFSEFSVACDRSNSHLEQP
jgi:hypothetical protein